MGLLKFMYCRCMLTVAPCSTQRAGTAPRQDSFPAKILGISLRSRLSLYPPLNLTSSPRPSTRAVQISVKVLPCCSVSEVAPAPSGRPSKWLFSSFILSVLRVAEVPPAVTISVWQRLRVTAMEWHCVCGMLALADWWSFAFVGCGVQGRRNQLQA
ncbi:hypothetical protein GE09DRAFT_1114467 [Coniochaeta sp. 2T2.1]|nr:hypothetical protein GE09DRAFT_1114467 [Coniochaeta sp. 2T2.1]